MFDWVRFLDTNNIAYRRTGPNHIAINCPYCLDDPSRHMVIALNGRGYHCWRCDRGGRAYFPLLMQLLGIPAETAKALLGNGQTVVQGGDESFAASIASKLAGRPSAAQPPPLEFLPEFTLPADSARAARLFMPYLQRRGYETADALRLIARFGLRCALTGAFAYRLIVPVYYNGELVNWTGRTVGDDPVRYKTLANEPRNGLPAARRNIKHCIFDYDALLRGGEILVIVEGPFDALRITFLGERGGIRAACLFGKAMSREQSALLRGELMPRYNKTVSLFDADTGIGGAALLADCFDVVDRRLHLPRGTNDPAELTAATFAQLFRATN